MTFSRSRAGHARRFSLELLLEKRELLLQLGKVLA
jgi:hypothetical protein